MRTLWHESLDALRYSSSRLMSELKLNQLFISPARIERQSRNVQRRGKMCWEEVKSICGLDSYKLGSQIEREGKRSMHHTKKEEGKRRWETQWVVAHYSQIIDHKRRHGGTAGSVVAWSHIIVCMVWNFPVWRSVWMYVPMVPCIPSRVYTCLNVPGTGFTSILTLTGMNNPKDECKSFIVGRYSSGRCCRNSMMWCTLLWSFTSIYYNLLGY